MPAIGRQPVSAQELKQIAAEMRSLADEFDRLAVQVKKQDGQTVQVMNLPMAKRGLESQYKLYMAVKTALGER